MNPYPFPLLPPTTSPKKKKSGILSVLRFFQVTQFVNGGLFESRNDLSTFKNHIRDFLVQSKEFSAQVKAQFSVPFDFYIKLFLLYSTHVLYCEIISLVIFLFLLVGREMRVI